MSKAFNARAGVAVNRADADPAKSNWSAESTGLPTETLKWIALLFMIADHVNKYLLDSQVYGLFAVGRLAMPIFVIVLGLNLARPRITAEVRLRMMRRLAVWGAVACVPCIALGHVTWGWWPLNILFTMLAIVAIVHGIQQGTVASVCAAALVFVLGGAAVEFWWFAILLGVGAYCFFRGSRLVVPGALLAALGIAGLNFVNDNFWALLALPLIAASCFMARTPRLGRFFYAAYPAHLALLFLIKEFLV